jgi:ketosteroid isomerase-like protein
LRVVSGPEEERRELFGLLKSPDTRARFWERVAADVDWTVEGTHPLAGRYRSKADFVSATFERMTAVFQEPATLDLEYLHLAGDCAIAELRFVARTKDGGTYDNPACWVCRFDGEQIVEVRAYLDSAMVAWVLMRNELTHGADG